MPAEHHDLVLAVTSHVPHLIAYKIVGTAYELPRRDANRKCSNIPPAGFATSPGSPRRIPTMWRDMFLHNKDAVLEMLGTLQ